MFRLAILVSHPIQYFVPLYRRLAKEPELSVKVLFCSRQGLDDYYDAGFGKFLQWDIPLLGGFEHVFLPNVRRTDNLQGFFSLVNPALFKELLTHRPDALLVPGHSNVTYIFGMLAARLLRIPVFMRCETHLLLQRSAVKRSVRRVVMGFIYRQVCARCLAIGSRNRDFYLSFGVPPERIFEAPYVVDNDFFIDGFQRHADERETVLGEIGLNKDVPIILFVAKLASRKRPMDLLRAYNTLRRNGHQAGLVFIGSGPLEDQLRAYTAENCLTDVRFLGFRNQSELPRYYAASDIFVLPSENEPWGLTINEVMCAGLPVVASEEIGAVPDLVSHGENGFTFPAGNIDRLTDSLERLVCHETLRREMGRRSLERIRQWNFDRCAVGFLDAMRSLKQGSGG